MNTTAIFFNGTEFTCTQFFISESNTDGIDVKDAMTGNHIGEILGITIPDIEDEDECIKFENTVTDWLTDKV